MSSHVSIPQRDLDALRAVVNAARHLTNVPLGIQSRGTPTSEVWDHVRRQQEAWDQLVEALGEVER